MIMQINYDLDSPGQKYSDLIEKIKSLGAWARPCKSSWLVKTNLSAQQVADSLKPFLDSNDKLLVNKFDTAKGSYAGWLDKDVIAWLNNNSSYANSFL
jgi:hypothetical protein